MNPVHDDAHDNAARLLEVTRWEAAAPSVGVRGLGATSSRAARLFRGAIPVSAIELALGSANTMATRTGGRKRLLARAGVDSVEALRDWPLADCDNLARRVQREAMAAAAATGATTGLGGATLMAVDIPTLITLCLRTIHRTAVSYGYALDGEAGRMLAIGLFALASANSADEKRAAIRSLSAVDPGATTLADLTDAAWREGIERASEREIAKQAMAFSVVNLSRQLGWNLARRKAAAAIPLIGAVVGGSVNAWTVYDLARTTRLAMLAWRLDHWGSRAALAGPNPTPALAPADSGAHDS